MNRPLSALALSLGLICSPALAQETAPAAETPAAEAPAAPAEDTAAPAPEAAPAEAPAAAAAPAEAAAPTVMVDSRVGPAPADKAQVVFFRPSKYMGGAVSHTIKEGETPVAKVTNGSYYIYLAEPGAHTYTVSSEATDTLTLEFDAGETYYVKQTMEMGALLYWPNMAPSDAAAFAALPKLKVAKPPKPAKAKT